MRLAIDTSTDVASLALCQEGIIVTELTWRCGSNHTVTLLPHLANLLNQQGAELRSLSSIVVAKGPGSFNGLRVGISTAKGLALGLGIPIAGVSTLEAAAYQHSESGFPVCSILNAGRGEIATAIYQRQNGDWQQVMPEQITTLEALCSQITSRTIFCGELTTETTVQLNKSLKQKAIITNQAASLRRAGFLAELGQKKLAAGSGDDPATLQPIYLRRPNITKPKKQLGLGGHGEQ
jgi:tRNA threonylcarbamoyl adenosine modification protein YeaZ